MNLRRCAGLIIAWGLTAGFGSVLADAPDPPEASFREKWVRVESSSPLFRLRNDRSDSPASPDWKGPKTPDSPEVEAPSARDEPDSPDGEQKDATQPSAEESSPNPDRNESPPSRPIENSKKTPSPKNGETKNGETSSKGSGPTSDKAGEQPEKPHDEETKAPPPLPSRREQRFTGERPLQPVQSAVYDSPVGTDTAAVAPGLMPTEDAARAPTEDFVPEWWIMGGAGIVLLGLGGLFVWMRRRRVRVVESGSLDTYEYFQRQFEAAGLGAKSEAGSTRTDSDSGEPDRRPVRPRMPPGEDPSAQGVDPWKLGDDQLRRAGIDPSYRPLLKQYYGEGRDPAEIARRLDMGEGEVGLVLDLARRNFTGDRQQRAAPANGQTPTSSRT